jgi:hypothetical protein
LQVTDDDIIFLQQTQGNKKQQIYRRDHVIERLQEALQNANMTSDNVCNLLANDLYEREKLKYQMANQSVNNNRRFTCRHLSIIESEFKK